MSRPVLWAAVLVGIMSLLRAYAAFNFPLTPDESYYWTWSLHPAFGYTDHPPMVAWLIALGNFLGHTYGAARLPFLIAEALAALAIGMAAKLLTGDTRAGAYTAIVFTLIPQTNLEFAECIPDGGYVLAWSLALWAAAALARRASPRATVALGAALAATVYSRTFGWALVFGIAAWAVFARRDLLRPVASACAIAFVAYIPFLIWNASVGWETFAFEFVHRQSVGVNTVSVAKVFDFGTVRFLEYGVLIVLLTWFVALRREPKLPLVAWTTLPFPLALIGLSFAMRTEAYWIVGPAASLSIGCGVVLARRTRCGGRVVRGPRSLDRLRDGRRRLPRIAGERAGRGVSRLARAAHADLLGRLRVRADGVRFARRRGRRRHDLHRPLRNVVGAAVVWRASIMVAAVPQVPQWSRWYRPAEVPQRADFVAPLTPFGDTAGLEQKIRAAYADVGPPKLLDYRYAGEPEVRSTSRVSRTRDRTRARSCRGSDEGGVVGRRLGRGRERGRWGTPPGAGAES